MTGVNWFVWLLALQTSMTGLFLLQVLKRQHDAKKKAVLRPVPISKRIK